MAVHGVVLVAAVLVGCNRASERQQELERILGAGTFVRIAATTVGGDHLEFLLEPERDEYFGRLLIVARDRSGRVIDFCEGTLNSTSRPYYQSERYSALVARDGDRRDVFFVYDAAEDRFVTRATPEHVHDGFIIFGDRILFSSCKTPEPVWLLDLESGKDISLGRGAPQAAAFAVQGSTVFVLGDGKVYELAGEALAPTRRRTPDAPPATGGFERIRTPSGS